MGIVRAAAQVFRARGFARAGMREIALAADLSPANLYHYFHGKDQILFFCQDRSLDRLLTALERARRRKAPSRERLRQLAIDHLLCLLDEVDGSIAHLEIDALPPSLRGRIVRKRDRYELGIRQIVKAGARRGDLRPCDPTVATRAYLGALNWTASWFRPGGSYSPEALAPQIADCAVGGLVAR